MFPVISPSAALSSESHSPSTEPVRQWFFPTKSLSGSGSSPPVAVIVCEDYLPVSFEQFSQVRSDKPPFIDFIKFIGVFDFVPKTVVNPNQFIKDITLFIQNFPVYNLLCCHII